MLSNSEAIYKFPMINIEKAQILGYVKHGRLDKFDIEILEFFAEMGFQTFLCSTDIRDSKHANEWVRKENFGRDSSFLRDFARNLQFIEFERLEIVILNDSMVWDSVGLRSLIEKLRASEHNKIFFPTESIYPKSHVQPYLIYASLDKDYVQKFSKSFEWIRTLHFKRSLIEYVEYPMLSKLEDQGWLVGVVVRHKDLFATETEAFNGKKLNPTQHLWRCLPVHGIVGIKRSLINTNPVNVHDAPRNLDEALTSLRKILYEL